MKKTLLVALLATTLQAEGLFSVGSQNFSFSLGSSSGFGNDYTVVGANVNYFVQENLSVGVGYQGYFGDDPKINQISVPITYYYPVSMQHSPYAGLIYRHTFISGDYEDYDIYGVRVGIAMQMSSNSYVSVGWVQEYSDFGDGGEWDGYPQVSMGFVF